MHYNTRHSDYYHVAVLDYMVTVLCKCRMNIASDSDQSLFLYTCLILEHYTCDIKCFWTGDYVQVMNTVNWKYIIY